MTTNKPHFMIIGAQKCGTTWLHQCLRQHPQIFLPEAKDDEFFSYHATPSDQQVDAWLKRYACAEHDALIGDATASYFWSPLAPPWATRPEQFNQQIPATLAQVIGTDLKIIILLRNPVQRAVSAYLHHISMGSLSANSSILNAPAELGIVSIGFFGQHLQHWLAHYPAESIYVETRSIRQAHELILADIVAFLGAVTFTFNESQAVVYGGRPRIINTEGVWIPKDSVSSLADIQRALPLTRIDDQQYLRLIHPDELAGLTALYRKDQALLQQLLDDRAR